ncbi:MAG: hypothetical protein Q9159_001505 [Coniocarpon cinnabarinum]
MAETTTPEKPHNKDSNNGAESPTTAQPLDFDDDMQETGVIANDGTTTSNSTPAKPPRTSSMQQQTDTSTTEEAPPQKPPRPMSAREQNQATLIEAFPSVDTKVVRAVLDASGNNVEKAFNALLKMSDPDFQEPEPEVEPVVEQPPQKPPRPSAQQQQLEQDELYARQLAAHYNSTGGQYGHAPRAPRGPPRQRAPNHEEEEEDDFAAIRENVRQGFLTTQTKVNKWITDFKKRMDGDSPEDEIGPGPMAQPQRQNFGPSQTRQMAGIRQMSGQRRSTDQDRYDADPKVLSDDFTQLEMHDEEGDEKAPKKPNRPLANPDLFKPTPPAPQSGPVDEVDALYSHPHPSDKRQPSPASGHKSKKWQPLTSVAPAPEADDNDPFSLGDSDEDKEEKQEEKKHDLRHEDSERLKKAAQSHENLDETKRRGSLQPTETHGTKDKVAEDLLKGGASK